MKFLLEDLEQDLIDIAEENEKMIIEITDMFTDLGFDVVNELNGISFTFKNDELEALFYIDTSSLIHNGYVTSETVNVSVKGDKDTTIKDAKAIASNVSE